MNTSYASSLLQASSSSSIHAHADEMGGLTLASHVSPSLGLEPTEKKKEATQDRVVKKDERKGDSDKTKQFQQFSEKVQASANRPCFSIPRATVSITGPEKDRILAQQSVLDRIVSVIQKLENTEEHIPYVEKFKGGFDRRWPGSYLRIGIESDKNELAKMDPDGLYYNSDELSKMQATLITAGERASPKDGLYHDRTPLPFILSDVTSVLTIMKQKLPKEIPVFECPVAKAEKAARIQKAKELDKAHVLEGIARITIDPTEAKAN